MNELTFDEYRIKELLIKTIEEAFRNDETREPDYWYEFFGGCDLQHYESLDESDYKFPCFNIELYPEPERAHSTEVEQFTRVDFYLQHFNIRIGENSKEKIGTAINHLIKQTLQKNFKVTISMNESMPNLADNSVYRRIIRGSFGYDNLNKIFYKGA